MEHKNVDFELSIEDEYNADKLCEIIEKEKRMMIRADFAGSGKSYTCKEMPKRGHNVIFVCPTNKLASDYEKEEEDEYAKYGINGITVNKFFGFGLTEDTKMTKFDDSEYDTVVFDEIVFHNTFILRKIKKYCENNPDKIIVATGDTNQLESVDKMTNTQDQSKYSDKCIDLIFKNRMYFQENKRLKSEEDKSKIFQRERSGALIFED
jgi:hypothetical protein